jgi:hypothetical protein
MDQHMPSLHRTAGDKQPGGEHDPGCALPGPRTWYQIVPGLSTHQSRNISLAIIDNGFSIACQPLTRYFTPAPTVRAGAVIAEVGKWIILASLAW